MSHVRLFAIFATPTNMWRRNMAHPWKWPIISSVKKYRKWSTGYERLLHEPLNCRLCGCFHLCRFPPIAASLLPSTPSTCLLVIRKWLLAASTDGSTRDSFVFIHFFRWWQGIVFTTTWVTTDHNIRLGRGFLFVFCCFEVVLLAECWQHLWLHLARSFSGAFAWCWQIFPLSTLLLFVCAAFDIGSGLKSFFSLLMKNGH